MINPLQKQLLDSVKKIRDEQRPKIEDVVFVIDKLIGDFRAAGGARDFREVLRGPETWSWVDVSDSELGYERWYVLTGSTLEGAEGYPLLTLRSAVSPRMDSWCTVSQMIVGTTLQAIETSVTMAVINHQGAFEGLKDSISDILSLMTAGRGLPSVGDALSETTSPLTPPKKGEVN